MKNRLFLFTTVYILFIGTMASADPSTAAKVDEKPAHVVASVSIVASFYDQVITTYDVEKRLKVLTDRNPDLKMRLDDPASAKTERKKVLNLLIDEKLLEMETAKRGIKISDAQVDAALESKKKELNMSTAEFEKALAKENLSLALYRIQTRAFLLRYAAEQNIVRSRITVGEQELKSYYEKNYHGSPAIDFIALFIPDKSAEPNAKSAKALCEEIQRELKKTPSLDDVAKTHAGQVEIKDYTDIVLTELSTEFQTSLKDLKKGDLSACIPMSNGEFIIRIYNQKESPRKDFESAKAEIKDAITRERSDGEFTRWMSEVRAKTAVKILNDDYK